MATTTSTLNDLSAEQRASLAAYLRTRNAYLKKAREYNKLLLNELQAPTDEGEKLMERFLLNEVEPARKLMQEQLKDTAQSFMTADGLKALLPVLPRLFAQKHTNLLRFMTETQDAGDDLERMVRMLGKRFKSGRN